MATKAILITGATGYLGTHVYEYLQQRFPQARILATSRKKPSGAALPADDNMRFVEDLTDKAAVTALLDEARPDIIYHFAGATWSANWDELYRKNIGTMMSVLTAVEKLRLNPRILIPGSAVEYGNQPREAFPLLEETVSRPISLYGVAKSCQTALGSYYSNRGLQVITARIFNVMGRHTPETMAVGTFAAQLKKIIRGEGPPVVRVRNLSSIRDYVDMSDLCEAVVEIGEKGRASQVYNICSGKGVTMQEIFTAMVDALAVKMQVKVQVDDTVPPRPGEIDLAVGSPEKTAEEIGWRARVPLAQAIQNTLND